MKSFTFLLLASVGVSFIFVSCEKESLKADKANNFETPFIASVNEHVALKNDVSEVMVTVKNIADRRCAKHLDCADEGIAAVRIEVTAEKSKAESFLYVGTVGEDRKTVDSVMVRLDNAWYIVSLHSVNPHPMMEASGAQTAEISIKPKL